MRDRSEALDAVRGIAIALVVGYHYWPALVPGGSVGVDLFFVLSGFLIGGILLDNKGAEDYFATFYWRRFFRILPLYWLFLSVMPASPVMPVWWFLPFAQNFGWIAHGVFPIREPHTVTWSLAFEEQFYLLLPTMVASLSTRWLIRVLWACVIAAPLWRYGLAQSHPFAARLLLPCRLDSLMGGALVACFMRGHARSALIWTTLACAAPCLDLALHSLTGNGELMYSVIAFLFAGGLLVVVQSRPAPLSVLRPLAWLGIGAYSIYLSHIPALLLTGSPALALPLTLALAWASWRYIEAPLIRFARARWRYGPASLAVPAE